MNLKIMQQNKITYRYKILYSYNYAHAMQIFDLNS